MKKHGDLASCQYDHNTDDEGETVPLGFKLVGLFVFPADGERELESIKQKGKMQRNVKTFFSSGKSP